MTCPPCTYTCEQGKTCPAKNNNEIIEIARQAGLLDKVGGWDVWFPDELEVFAKLVAAKEREHIEKEWDKLYGWWTPDEEKNNV